MQFRKSKTFGGLRVNASKGGVGVSFGKGPLRVGVGADGKVRRTVRVPGTGVYDTKVIGSTRTAKPKAAPARPRSNDAPRCTTYQQVFVATKLHEQMIEKGVVDIVPDLSDVTVAEAEQILHRLGADPSELYREGRMQDKAAEQAEWAARFDLRTEKT